HRRAQALAVTVGREPGRGPDEVHRAGLHGRLRPGRGDLLAQPAQPVTAADDDVSQATVAHLRERRSPRLPSAAATQIPSTCLTPSQSIPTAMFTALFRTAPPSRTLATSASTYTMGEMASSGRPRHARISSPHSSR